jgi:stage V sporulation protein B
LGAIYKIPLGNILGDEGYTYFLSAYNIYNVFLTLATAGLPVALSRMISEANTLGREMQVRRTFSVAFGTFFVLGIFCSIVMYLFPTELAVAIGWPEASQSIWALSPSVLLVCLTSSYRGYCQGHENMTPTTIGQVLETFVKVIVGLLLATLLVRSGKSIPVAAAGAIFGVTVGGFAVLVYMAAYKRRHYRNSTVPIPDIPESRGRILRNLLRIGIPIAIGASILSLINLIDTALVSSRLQDGAGFSYENAKALYGVYGKAQTLYNLPAAFITQLAISVVPAIAACMAKRNTREAFGIAEASLRIATVIALPMGVGLSVLSYPIINVLYPDSNEAGPALLSLLGVAAFFVCIALIQTAILQASGNEKYPMYSMLAGGIAKIIVNWYLVGTPSINIYGAPVGTICCDSIMCLMNFIFICRFLEKRPRFSKIFLRPFISASVMGVTAWGVYFAASRLLGGSDISFGRMAVAMLAAVFAAVIAYIAAVVLTRSITMEDMKLIPKGEKLAKLLKIR